MSIIVADLIVRALKQTDEAEAGLRNIKAGVVAIGPAATDVAVASQAAWSKVGNVDLVTQALTSVQARSDQLQQTFAKLALSRPTIIFDTNLQQVQSQFQYIDQTLEQIGNVPHPILINQGDLKAANDLLKTMEDQILNLAKEHKINVTLDGTAASTGAAGVANSIKQVETEANLATRAVTLLTDTLGSMVKYTIIGAILGLVASFEQAIQASIDWNTTLNQLQGNTTLTNQEIAKLRDNITQMASSTNADMNQIAEGYMHATNLGFSLADSQKIVNAAFASSASTGANLSDTVNSVASVLKEYSMSGDQAAKATDLLHNSAAQGNMTMEEFVSAGGRTIATAANLGDSLVDISAAYAALSRHGMDASVVGTQLTGILTHIVNPTSAARAEIEHLSKVTGIDLVDDFTQAGLQSKGLYGIMNDVKTATAGDTSEILKLIPALRGGQGALSLAGNAAQDFTTILSSDSDVINGKYTPSAENLNRTTETTGYKLGIAANQAKLFGMATGDYLVGGIENADFVFTHLNDTINSVSNHLGLINVTLSDLTNNIFTSSDRTKQFYADLGKLHDQSQKNADSMRTLGEQTISLAMAQAQSAQTAEVAFNTQKDSLLTLDEATAKSTDTIASALRKMATDTSDSSKTAAQGIDDLAKLIHSMPDQLSPDMQNLADEMSSTLASIKTNGGISGQGLHDIYLGWIQQMAQSADFETRQMGQAILDNLKAVHDPASETALQLGQDYITNLVDGQTKEWPALNAMVKAVIDNLDISQITAMMGKDAGQKYIANMTAQMSQGLDQMVAKLSTGGVATASLAGPFKQVAAAFHNQALSMATDLGLIGDHFGKTSAEVAAANAKLVKETETQAKTASDAVKAQAKALESNQKTVITSIEQVQEALHKGGDPAIAISQLMQVADEATAAHMPQIANTITGWVDKAAKGVNVSGKEISDTLNGWMNDAAKGSNATLAVWAQGALATIDAANDKADTAAAKSAAAADKRAAAAQAAAEKHAAALAKAAETQAKAQAVTADTMIKDLGRAELATVDATKTISQAYEDLLPILQSKLPAGMDWLQNDYTDMLAKIESATPPSLAQISQQFQDWNTRLINSNNATWRLMAQANADAFAEAQAKYEAALDAKATKAAQAASAEIKQQQSVTDSLGKLATDTTKSAFTSGDAQVAVLDMISAATTAKMPDMVNFATSEYNRLASGAGLSMQQVHDDTIAKLRDLVATGPPIVRQFAQAQLDIISAADAAIVQKNQEMHDALIGSFSTVEKDLSSSTHDLPQTVMDIMNLEKQAETDGMTAQANALRAAAKQMWSGTAADYQAGSDAIQKILTDLGTNGDLIAQATVAKEKEDYQAGLTAIVDAHQKAVQSIIQAEGSLATMLSGANLSVPQALIDTYNLIDQLKSAGQGDWAAKLLKDAQDVASGVPGAINMMSADVVAALVKMEEGSDPVMAAWAALMLENAKKAAEAVQTSFNQAATAAEQSAQSLATGLSSVGQAILSGKDSPLQALQALGPLADAAVKAGLTPVANQIEALMAKAAAGGKVSLQELMDVINQTEQQLAASGNANLAVIAQQAQAEIAHAQAVAQATLALIPYQQALDAANEKLANAQAYYSQLNDQLSAMKTQLQDVTTQFNSMVNAPLQGEGKFKDQIFNNKMAQEQVQLQINQLQQMGASAATLKPLQDQLAQLSLQGQQLNLQESLQFDPLKKQLQDLVPKAKELTFQEAYDGALKYRGEMDKLNPQIAAQTILVQKANAAQKAASDAVKQANLAYKEQQDVLNALNATIPPALAAINSNLQTLTTSLSGGLTSGISQGLSAQAGGVTEGVNSVVDVITATFKNGLQISSPSTLTAGMSVDLINGFTQGMQNNASQLKPGFDAINGAFNTGLSGIANEIKLATDPASPVMQAWAGPKGLMYELQATFGGIPTVIGNASSFWPNVREAMVTLLTVGFPEAINSNFPAVVKLFHSYLMEMFNAAMTLKSDVDVQANLIGTSMDAGIKAGIDAGRSDVIDAMVKVVDDAISAAKKAAGIASPSALTNRELGKPLMQGVAVGAEEEVGNTARRFAAAVSTAVAPTVVGISGNGGSLGQPIASSVGTGAGAGGGTVNIYLNVSTAITDPSNPSDWEPYARAVGVALQRRGIIHSTPLISPWNGR